MCPACLRGTMTVGPDVIRGPGPNHSHGLDAHDPESGLSQSTARPFRITPSSPSQFDYLAPPSPHAPIAKPLQAAAASSGARLCPRDARHLVGNGNGDELGRLLGQQPHDPGMLLRMLPGISNNSCCTVDEQSSEIAIS